MSNDIPVGTSWLTIAILSIQVPFATCHNDLYSMALLGYQQSDFQFDKTQVWSNLSPHYPLGNDDEYECA